MVVVLTYWLSYEYVRDPRNALEPESAQAALLRGAHHVLNLLVPYLEPGQRMHLLGLVSAYNNPSGAESTRRHHGQVDAFPHAGDYTFDAASVRRQWAACTGDAEPCPPTPPCWKPGRCFTTATSRKPPKRAEAGGAGLTVANKATCIYATYLENKEKVPGSTCSWKSPAAPRRRQRKTRETPTPGTGRPMRWAATARASAWPRRWRRAWAPR
jgi:hypothetical protein